MFRRLAVLFTPIVILILLSGCATTRETSPGIITVAVWDIEDLSFDGSTRPDLGMVFSAEIIEALKNHAHYEVVERQRLLQVLEELNIGSSELAEETTRLQIGRIVGAAQMVFGGYQIIGDTMRIDLRLVEVSSGKIINASQRSASSSNLSAWISAAREAGHELTRE